MKIRHIDHIGINVIDLNAAKIFFIDLGFKMIGEAEMKGELVEKVIGLKGVHDKSCDASISRWTVKPRACEISSPR